jgi:heptosyltransferase-2
MIDKSCKNVLVRGVNWIGDGVMTLPALSALRKAIPEAKISLLVKPWVSPLFENNPNIDEIIIYSNEFKGMKGKIKLSRMLRKKNFCSSILFQNAFDAALITFLAGIKERVGYNRDGRGLLMTTAVSVPKNEKEVHQINYYLNLLEQIGITVGYSAPYIYLTLDERLYARDVLKDMKRPIIGINPGATYGSAKRWFPERFAEIANWFIKDTLGSVIIFGGKNEVDIAQEIEYFVSRQHINEISSLQPPLSRGGQEGGVLNLAGKTSLRELISLISDCDVFVANDSGPMHVAYAVRTPLVAIFGSTDPKLTGPLSGTDTPGWGDRNVVITPDLPCSPCFERTCKNNDMRCMYAITSDDVYYGIKKALPDRAAVFLDRDGTLCRDTGYLNKHEDLQIFSEIDSLKLLKERGLKIIGITNQSGIAKGIVDEEFVKKVNNIFIQQYGFDDFYYCPHHPDEHCPCRKPEPEMLLKARVKYGINLKKSYVVGDKEADMLLARAVGAKGVLVRTGEKKESANADYTAEDLTEAVDWILKKVEGH